MVMYDSSRPHGLQPIRLLRLWDFPSKSTGVGCHCLLRSILTSHLKKSQDILGKEVKTRVAEGVRMGLFVWHPQADTPAGCPPAPPPAPSVCKSGTSSQVGKENPEERVSGDWEMWRALIGMNNDEPGLAVRREEAVSIFPQASPRGWGLRPPQSSGG